MYPISLHLADKGITSVHVHPFIVPMVGEQQPLTETATLVVV
jgi:hypothetical protein